MHPRTQLLCMLQVQLQLVSAAVKLFLKKPTGKPQAMIQLVLTYATQVATPVALTAPSVPSICHLDMCCMPPL
jgi:hypothetical protein